MAVQGGRILAGGFIAAVLAALGLYACLFAGVSRAGEKKDGKPSRLLVVWTSGDKEVAVKMVYMYTLNAKKQGWFDEVRFLIWGPSSRLLAEDGELQDYLKRMKEAGVEPVACKACADMYGVSGILEGLGVDVKYMGKPLSDMLESDWIAITF